MQFNDGGVLGGTAGFTFNKTSNAVVTTGDVAAKHYNETVYSFGNATGTITPDINNGAIQTMTLTGNITFSTINNISSGDSATFVLTQDGTGNRLLTSTMKFAGNLRALSTTANSVDIISVFYSGTTYYATITKGYA